jgi:uncharacterized protein DUF2510
MGAVIAIVIIVFIVLFVLSKSVNSINKSVQKMQGRDRCVACKRRLKAVNGVYAKKCSKCGADQPSDFDRIMAKTKMSLQQGERGLNVGPVTLSGTKGQLVLTNKRLHFQPKGSGGPAKDWPLQDVTKVSGGDTGGVAIDTHSGDHVVFVAGKAAKWKEPVLNAANSPLIKQLRSQSSAGSTASAPPAVVTSPPSTRAPEAAAPAGTHLTTPVPAAPGTPAGWLADPAHRHEQRYWDGSRWTEHVSSGGEQTTDFL